MARGERKIPTQDEAMATVAGRPVMTLAHLATLKIGTRMTLAKEANAGNLPGAFKVGKQFKVATAPWRQKLGILASPELAKFGGAGIGPQGPRSATAIQPEAASTGEPAEAA